MATYTCGTTPCAALERGCSARQAGRTKGTELLRGGALHAAPRTPMRQTTGPRQLEATGHHGSLQTRPTGKAAICDSRPVTHTRARWHSRSRPEAPLHGGGGAVRPRRRGICPRSRGDGKPALEPPRPASSLPVTPSKQTPGGSEHGEGSISASEGLRQPSDSCSTPVAPSGTARAGCPRGLSPRSHSFAS